MGKDKIILLGANGMAGHMIYEYLHSLNKYNIIPCVRKSEFRDNDFIIDVNNLQKLKNLLFEERPKYIINAIGVLIQGSKKSSSDAIFINSYLPHKITEYSNVIGAKLIHLSTDCVFNGNNSGGYTENSLTDANDTYGKSKALGEVINDKDTTLRTSIIGPELKNNGEGLFDWFMKSNGKIKGFSEVYWSGITTLELSKVIEQVISNNIIGLCHITNNIKISKYELINLFNIIWKRDRNITPDSSFSKDKSFLDTKNKIDLQILGYKDMLNELKTFMEGKLEYKQYEK